MLKGEMTYIPAYYKQTQRYRNVHAEKLSENFSGVDHQVVYKDFYALAKKYDISLKTVLDFGAGNGRDAIEFAKQGISVMAMEPGGILTETIFNKGSINGMSEINLDSDEGFTIFGKKEDNRIDQWFLSITDTPGSFHDINYYTQWLRNKDVIEKSACDKKDDQEFVYDAYDAVICNAFAHYIHPNDRLYVVRHMINIVKPGGLIMFKGRDCAINNAKENSWGITLPEMENYFSPKPDIRKSYFENSDLGFKYPPLEILHAAMEPSFSTKLNQTQPHNYPVMIVRKGLCPQA